MEILKFFGVTRGNGILEKLKCFCYWMEKSKKICNSIYKQLNGSLESDDLGNFLNYLAELNIYRRLSRFEHKLECEPNDAEWADIRINGEVHISIKNLKVKDYSKGEVEKIKQMQADGVTETNIDYTHTSVDIYLEVDHQTKIQVAHRTESPKNGLILHSDFVHMRTVLNEMGFLEKKDCTGKRVLLYFIQSGVDFGLENAKDICDWYYDKQVDGRIFESEPLLYWEHFHKLVKVEDKDKTKKKNIEAIIFLWQEKNYVLDWPEKFPSLTPTGLRPLAVYADGDPKLCERLIQQLLP